MFRGFITEMLPTSRLLETTHKPSCPNDQKDDQVVTYKQETSNKDPPSSQPTLQLIFFLPNDGQNKDVLESKRADLSPNTKETWYPTSEYVCFMLFVIPGKKNNPIKRLQITQQIQSMQQSLWFQMNATPPKERRRKICIKYSFPYFLAKRLNEQKDRA